ncbi:ribosome silencing factor [Youxingia wuxianensis]|uniref:Ribosomal silencing factor RsfS n=1 Tax=Youxingia wuxianensis TaxID=2763678 RepID=A0A926IGL3_9FIRM|nr:ribosome silencing factor [Youxingia wuxianensis]MBC8584371.1 ribosome silencing factor [Youxingia wuxianensis]
MTSYEMVLKVAKLLDDKKAVDIKALEIKDLTTIGDYFVIASGTSNIQVKALADEVEEGLSKLGYEPRRIEGYQSAMWVVLDYYDVIVHIFYEQTREFYSLERLWADAPTIQLDLDK